jgi:hypothetical protein
MTPQEMKAMVKLIDSCLAMNNQIQALKTDIQDLHIKIQALEHYILRSLPPNS